MFGALWSRGLDGSLFTFFIDLVKPIFGGSCENGGLFVASEYEGPHF